jgi:putative transposase
MRNGKRVLGVGASYYHCMSRIVGGERLLEEGEREVLRKMLWQVAEFCGVRIVTYAVLSNHFHVLVWVPAKGEVAIDDEELVRRYGVLYGESRSAWHPRPEVLREWLRDDERRGRLWRSRLQARMEDVSAFVRTVKQRFSFWYNRAHGRFGTLWAERFKSVLIEGSPRALMTVAAYIDLNPVRAGMAEDPADYRWCGYAEAMGGATRAREGLARVVATKAVAWKTVAAPYRRFLYGKGESGAVEAAKIPRARVLEVLEKGGMVTRGEALRCRVRYFTDGAVLGSEAFLRAYAGATVSEGEGRRALKPRPMKGAPWDGLMVLRDLRRKVFG